MSSDLIPTPKNTGIETAASASAALAKATIEAKFVIALRPENRRNIDVVRENLISACRRPLFAQTSRWTKVQGRKEVNGKWEDNWIEGWTIRFAETAIQAWKNLDVSTVVCFEDETKRIIRTVVTDLETNISYTEDQVIEKQVERSKVREGQIVLAERQNTKGQKVFVVRATEDEITNRINSARSKAIRNSGLRMIPADVLEEALEAVIETKEKAKASENVAQAVPKLLTAFKSKGVSAEQIERRLGCKPERMSADQLQQMREIYSAISDGQASWADYETETKDPSEINIKPEPSPTAEPKSDPKPEAAKSPSTNIYLSTLKTSIAREKLDERKVLKAIHGLRRETEGANTLDALDPYHDALKAVIAGWTDVVAAVKEMK